MKAILLALWQLPQTLLGRLLVVLYRAEAVYHLEGATVYSARKMQGCISLGEVIILGQGADENSRQHEYGHCLQSRILGPLYLIVIGVPSFVMAQLSMISYLAEKRDGKRRDYWRYYFMRWPENWADKLGGVVRPELPR